MRSASSLNAASTAFAAVFSLAKRLSAQSPRLSAFLSSLYGIHGRPDAWCRPCLRPTPGSGTSPRSLASATLTSAATRCFAVSVPGRRYVGGWFRETYNTVLFFSFVMESLSNGPRPVIPRDPPAARVSWHPLTLVESLVETRGGVKPRNTLRGK